MFSKVKVTKRFTQSTRTHQSFKQDADVNNILTKYKKTGFLVDPSLVNTARVPKFGDFSDLGDFSTVMNRVKEAEASFIRLPARVRAKFDNDLQKAVEFIADPRNVQEAVDLGLLPAELLPVPVDNSDVNPEATPASPAVATPPTGG